MGRKRVMRQILDSTMKPATRTCLCCDRPFASTWAGNRICPSCRYFQQGIRHEKDESLLAGNMCDPCFTQHVPVFNRSFND